MHRALIEIQRKYYAAFAPPPRPWHSDKELQAELAATPRRLDWLGIERLMGPEFCEQLRANLRPPVRRPIPTKPPISTYTSICGVLIGDPKAVYKKTGGELRKYGTAIIQIHGGAKMPIIAHSVSAVAVLLKFRSGDLVTVGGVPNGDARIAGLSAFDISRGARR